jgi:predicted transcriptional regulator
MEPQTDKMERLLSFFKLLADEKRLQIVGLLARQSYPVEELAAITGLSSATVSHHLSRLVGSGLVTARVEGHYHVYTLNSQALRDMAQELLTTDVLRGTADDLDLDAYDRKILRDYIVDGRLTQIPMQRKKREAILRHLATFFEPGRQYKEREVNEIISRLFDDFATLRRELIDGGWLARDHDVYWKVER